MEKTIEIPFGAKDSELKGWEYTIPENMEAEIKDGKIIVREKESDDERIRKDLITFICQFAPEHLKVQYVAYLEKQKEQKSLSISAASEWLRKHISRYMNSEYNEFHKCVEYDGSIDEERLINDFEEAMQKEQNPIKVYDNMDDLIADAMIDEISKSDMPDSAKHNRIYWINKHRQKPAEWSEEDKVMLNNIIWSVHMKSIIKPLYEMDDRSRYKKYEDFLKALPERFNLQPNWKPSKEQMKALNAVANEGVLLDLFNDLLKLL